ncbi:hypothetical protein JTB14_010731 [Gonioctena quinquepunctata]|nr:hypothetical protein JTB14_010731 [Gonioctena quinquepunctata]
MMNTLFYLGVSKMLSIPTILALHYSQLQLNHLAAILREYSPKYVSSFRCEDKYYFTNYHSCVPEGKPMLVNDRTCVTECDNLQGLCRICKRCLEARYIAYTLTRVDINSREDVITHQAEQLQQQLLNPKPATVDIQTSVMLPIESAQPDVANELEVSENVNEIRRKTNDNIVNEAHEIKAEELARYQLFPHGKNGLKSQRPVNLSPFRC